MIKKMTESELLELIRRRTAGEVTFSEFLNELTEKGIHVYEIDVASAKAIYKGVDYDIQMDTLGTFEVSDTFNRGKVIQAIENISLPFLEFLNEIAKAGITTYRLFIPEKKLFILE